MVANTPRTRKTKGQEFQKKVVKKFRERFNFDADLDDCFVGDIQANPMGQSSVDVKLSPKAQLFIPFDIECKRVEKLNIWSALDQAEANTGKGRIPLVVFKKNRSKTYAVIELDKLLYLMD